MKKGTSYLTLIVIIFCVSPCYSAYDDGGRGECPKPVIAKKTIIKSKESIANGAELLKRETVVNARYCYELCCTTGRCNVALMHYESAGYDEYTGEAITTKHCYLFACGYPSVCTFDSHSRYAVIKISQPQKEQQEGKSVLNNNNGNDDCPPGTPVAMCSDDPCKLNSCPAHEDANCKPNYCGGCHAIYYDDDNKQLNCTEPVTTKQPNKVSDDNELDHNEQSVVVGSTDYAEAPSEGLQPIKPKEEPKHKKQSGSEQDPYFNSERRTWVTDGDDDEMNKKRPIVPTTQTLHTDTKGPIIDEIPIEIHNNESGLHSIPLLIALIICILFVIGLVYHFKCAKRGRVKKVQVDDGDYLINGMYL